VINSLERYVNRHLEVSGHDIDSRRVVRLTTYSTLILLSISLVFAYLHFTNVMILPLPLLIMIITSPVLPIIITLLIAKYLVLDVKKGIEYEYPFFTILLSAVHECGGDIIDAFEYAKHLGLKWFNREWNIIKRYSISTNSIIKALELRARNHPNIEFQKLILNYLSTVRSSGELSTLIRVEVKSSLESFSIKINTLIRQLIEIVSGFLSGIVVAVLFIIISIILGVSPTSGYIIAVILFVLLLSLAFRVNQALPNFLKIEFTFSSTTTKLLIIMLPIIIIVLSILIVMNNIVIVLIIPVLAIYSIITTKYVRECIQALQALPDLVREFHNLVKSGLGVKEAFLHIDYSRYPKKLSRHFKRILKYGDVDDYSYNWIVNYVFKFISLIYRIGIPIKTLTLLTDTLLTIRNIVTNTRYSARSLDILSYSVPLIFIIVITLTHVFLNSLLSLPMTSGMFVMNTNSYMNVLSFISYIFCLGISFISTRFCDLVLGITLPRIISPILALTLTPLSEVLWL